MGDNAAVLEGGSPGVGSAMLSIPNPLSAGLMLQSSRSDDLSSFLPAFLKAKRRQEAAMKNASNVILQSRYADLAEVLRVVEEPAHEEGLVGIATVVQASGMFGIDYRL